jgi:hypothetical protein
MTASTPVQPHVDEVKVESKVFTKILYGLQAIWHFVSGFFMVLGYGLLALAIIVWELLVGAWNLLTDNQLVRTIKDKLGIDRMAAAIVAKSGLSRRQFAHIFVAILILALLLVNDLIAPDKVTAENTIGRDGTWFNVKSWCGRYKVRDFKLFRVASSTFLNERYVSFAGHWFYVGKAKLKKG